MAELFQRNKSTISRHIENVFEEGELKTETTVAFLQQFKRERSSGVFPCVFRKELLPLYDFH